MASRNSKRRSARSLARTARTAALVREHRLCALRSVGQGLLDQIDPDSTREGLRETPERFAKACLEWFDGYDKKPEDVFKVFTDGAEKHDEIVLQKSIPFFSHCEHHVAPFFGVVHVGYLPQGKIIGLSKLVRLVNVFAHRLQVQERLTTQIAEAIELHLSPNVAVIVKAKHFCMQSRGVCVQGTETTSSAMLGVFRTNPAARGEFLALVSAP